MEKNLSQTVKEQAEQIRQLTKALVRLEKRVTKLTQATRHARDESRQTKAQLQRLAMQTKAQQKS